MLEGEVNLEQNYMLLIRKINTPNGKISKGHRELMKTIH